MKRFLALLLTIALSASLLVVSAGAAQNGKAGENTILDMGDHATAVVKPDGSLWIWGYNEFGQLGNGTKAGSTVPNKLMDNVTSVSCGGLEFNAAIKSDGSLWVWGSNNRTPTKVMDNVASVSCGSAFMAAVKTDGTLWTWGDNTYGQLGNGTIESSNVPLKIMDNVKSVSCGTFHAAAIKSDGSLWVWGNNANGQVGNGGQGDQDNHSPKDEDKPVQISSTGEVVALDWLFQTKPVKVMDNAASISCDVFNTAAIKTDGTLWMWGDNRVEQLVKGIGRVCLVPAKIMDNVVFVSLGTSSYAVIDANGSLWTWGNNTCGELGNSTIQNSCIAPLLVMDNVAAVSTDYHCTAALKTDGTLWLWGDNTNGYLGFPDTNDSYEDYDFVGTEIKKCTFYCQSVPFQFKEFASKTTTSESHVPTGAGTISDWAKDGVTAAYKAGIVPELTGNPGFQDAITREQFAELVIQVLSVLLGESPDISNATAFSDCDNAKVIAASAAGIVSGIGDNMFSPNTTTNREQIAAMIYRAIDYVAKEANVNLAPAAADLSKFSDKGEVSGWALDGVGTLAANGIMSGTSATTLSPKSSCTVEQSILLLYRVYEKFQTAK